MSTTKEALAIRICQRELFLVYSVSFAKMSHAMPTHLGSSYTPKRHGTSKLPDLECKYKSSFLWVRFLLFLPRDGFKSKDVTTPDQPCVSKWGQNIENGTTNVGCLPTSSGSVSNVRIVQVSYMSVSYAPRLLHYIVPCLAKASSCRFLQSTQPASH